jgi:hypothetical protein
MKRLKITESQATLLKKLGANKKTLKLTSEQFNRLCEATVGAEGVVKNFKNNASKFGVPPYKFKEGVENEIGTNELKKEVISLLKNALSGAEVKEIPPVLQSMGISPDDINNLVDDDFINASLDDKKNLIDGFVNELIDKQMVANEITSAGSVGGSFVGPVILQKNSSSDTNCKITKPIGKMTTSTGGSPSEEMNSIISDSEEVFSEEDVMESTGVSANATYDAPGFAPTKKGTKVGPYVQNIDVYQTNKLTKNEGVDNTTNLDATAWPDGEFVDFDDCVKLNNNKVAQNGGCSQGDSGVVKLKKTKKSIISNQKG